MSVYVPAIATVALLLTEGFCWLLLNEFGPVQLQANVGFPATDAFSVSGLPVQTGLLEDTCGVAGF